MDFKNPSSPSQKVLNFQASALEKKNTLRMSQELVKMASNLYIYVRTPTSQWGIHGLYNPLSYLLGCPAGSNRN